MDVQKIEGLVVALAGGVFWSLMFVGAIPKPAFVKSGWASKLFPWMGPMLIACGVFIAFESKPAPKVDLDAIAIGIKRKITLPVAVDADTRLDDVRAIDGALGYFLTITSVDTATPDVAAKLESHVRKTACSNPAYKDLFEAAISVRVVYKTHSGDGLADIALSPADCKF
jgi:hypothetical protein